jgi:hypothetical protein
MGIGASFAVNSVIAALLFRGQDIDNSIFWQVTLQTSLAAFLLGSLPVFTGMAIIAVIVQRQATRSSETKSLLVCLQICLLLAFLGSVVPTVVDFEPRNSPLPRINLSIEIAVVCAILSCLIVLNLLSRRMGLQRDRFKADNPDRQDDNGG